MEKLTFLPNGQWELYKNDWHWKDHPDVKRLLEENARKKKNLAEATPLEFKHKYSDPEERETFYENKEDNNMSLLFDSLTNQKPNSNVPTPSRYADPKRTDEEIAEDAGIKVGGTHVDRRHWFSIHHPEHGEIGLIPWKTKTDVNNPGEFEHSEFAPKEKYHETNLMDNVKKFGLNRETIVSQLQEHFDKNINSKSKINKLHNNPTTTPLEYISKKPDQKLQ